jgi:hypothetical protein
MEVQLFELFGISLQDLAFVSGSVYLIVEFFKRKFPVIFVGKWKTDLLALVFSFGVAFKVHGLENLESFIALGIAAWIIPAGFHKAKNGKK